MAETEGRVDAEPRQQTVAAPYMSYKGFKNYLTRFQAAGLPARFDGSYFGNASGSIVAQVRGTLHYFGFIDDDREPTDDLKIIAESTESQIPGLLKPVFEDRYSDCLSLAKNATYDQLAEVFRTRGLSGATVRKAITFFIGMAEDVGAQFSPHFKTARGASTGNGAKRRPRKPAETPPPPPAQHDRVTKNEETSTEVLRAKYINLLMKKVEDSEELPDGILDRIERALGYEDVAAKPSGNASPDDVP